MIYYELNEANPQSLLPAEVLAMGKPYPDLEELTGADFVVLPEKSNYEKVKELQAAGKNLVQISQTLNLDLPQVIELTESKNAIIEWAMSGALLVQRKSGNDFLQSLGPRLNHSIAKMCEVTRYVYQRIVLVTGDFQKSSQFVALNGKQTQWNWSSYRGALESIKYKGAIFEQLQSDDDIADWIERQEKRILAYKSNDLKWIVPTTYYPPDLPDTNDPLQLMRPVTDARLSLINIKGWGIEKVNDLQEHVQKSLRLQNSSPTLLQLLSYATSFETANHVHGVGKTLIQNARDHVGLRDGEYLAVSDSNITVQAN